MGCNLYCYVAFLKSVSNVEPSQPLYFQFDLDVRHFSHEPLARVIAQALPVLDVKFHLHLSLHLIVCPVFFRFNGFFDEDSTQETLYHNSVCPLIPYVLQGHNASVFAYGPTGAGMEIFQL